MTYTPAGLSFEMEFSTRSIAIASPQLFAHAPDAARLFLNSGIFLTAATAVLLNLFFSSKAEN
jgi:xanthine/uracil permease